MEILSLVLGQAEFSQVLKKHEGNEQCDKCSYKSQSIKIWKIILTEHIWELHFSVINVMEPLQRRVV